MAKAAGSSRFRILAYGVETTGLNPLPSQVETRSCQIEFHPHGAAPKFQEFDGVIVFQRTFEKFEPGRFHLIHHWDRDELDRRFKEAISLLGGGGFACFLLTAPFLDYAEGRDYSRTDLAKRFLPLPRTDFPARSPHPSAKVEDLRTFLDAYGAAWSALETRSEALSCKPLATVGGETVAVAIEGRVFAIPSLIPRSDDVEEFFKMLADGLVSLWQRLKVEIPAWAAQYRFPGEVDLLATREELSARVTEIDQKLKTFERLKSVLVAQSEALVDAVSELFDQTLPLKARHEEAFREDLTLTDDSGSAVALAEVKGVGKGVAREYINQVDSHRERTGKSRDFPGLLIINTNVKNAASMGDKDVAPATEQVKHAVVMNVLILRTLDLLNLASLHLSNRLTSAQVVGLLTKSAGWLKVDDSAEVISS